MPEEQNRVLTDHISTLLLCPTETAVKDLEKEGITKGIYNVGAVMYDTVLYSINLAEKKQDFRAYLNGLKQIGNTKDDMVYSISPKEYYLATIHRAENTDSPQKLRTVLTAFETLDMHVLFPIHPRTRKLVGELNLTTKNIVFVEPVGYLEMLILTKNAKKVLTDSGGLQKEAYFLDTPCVTLRDQTEWVETLEGGWNVLSSIDEQEIVSKVLESFKQEMSQKKDAFGNGQAAYKIVELLEE